MQNTRDLERNINKQFIRSDEPEMFGQPKIVGPIWNHGSVDQHELSTLQIFKREATRIVDLFDEMLMELMLVENPEYKANPEEINGLFKQYKLSYTEGEDDEYSGSWVYYPNGTLLHLLTADDHYRLRTSRNIGLMTEDEQNNLKDIHIAVGGLSVGGLCATTLAMEGINSFYLTDFDQLACSNLNRIASSLSHVGVEKSDIIAQKIWDIDPFASVVTNNQGFNQQTESLMFPQEKLPNVVIDAMDSMEAKIAIREVCRKHGIPLVWMIDMGDGVVQIGTERYDLDKDYPAFHGGLIKMEEQVKRPLNYLESCFSIFNHDYLPHRMADSFMKACNNQCAGISQLSSTVNIAAGAIAKVVRKIIQGESVVPEFFIEIDEKADPDYSTKKDADRESTHQLMASLGLR